MKKNFGFDTKFNKIKVSARSLWMGFERGEGELEIENQGRFDQSRFSQETEAIGQQTPRIGESRSKLRFTQRVSSAGSTLNSDSTPQFLSSKNANHSLSNGENEDLFLFPDIKISAALAKQTFSLSADGQTQFPLQEKTYQGPFPLQGTGAISGIHFTISSSEIELKKSQNELATLSVAGKTQKRLDALLKAAARDEDPTV